VVPFDLISFDLQGTLSDSAFSDEFWLDLLPRLYAEKHGMAFEAAQEILKREFKSIGKYDPRYYSAQYWISSLCPHRSFSDVIARLVNKPLLFEDTLELVTRLSMTKPLIIVSTTTHEFIDVELGPAASSFKHVYSSLDDFGVAGKTSDLFQEIASRLGVPNHRILHIGDCPEMDIANARQAGWQVFHFSRQCSRKENIFQLLQTLEAAFPTAVPGS
jgi:5'-nucleotidase